MSSANYLDTLSERYPSETLAQLEARCVMMDKPPVDKTHHFVQLCARLMPEWEFHPWRLRTVRAAFNVLQDGRKELSIHGSSNSHKTSTMALIAIALWVCNNERTSIYVTSPFKEATESGFWSQVVEVFADVKAVHPWIPWVLTKNLIKQKNVENPRSFIKLVTLDKVGKMVGRKQRITVGKESWVAVFCDEAPEFTGTKMKSVMKINDNMRSLSHYLFMCAGNFADPFDLLGDISAPIGKYEDLDVDKDQQWETRRGGLCIRMDGHMSPNVIAGYEKYPGLTTKKYCDGQLAIAGGNTNDPSYMRFVRSFPVVGDVQHYVLTRTTIANCPYAQDVTFEGGVKNLAFMDPGYGGDPCMMQRARVGKVMINTDKGTIKQHHIKIYPP